MHVPRSREAALRALFGYDSALREVVRTASQPALAAIKLAWWRDAAEALDHAPPPAEPRLRAVAGEILPRGASGAQLAGLEAGWAALLEEGPPDPLAVAARGRLLFALAARLLNADEDRAAAAGALWGLADAAQVRPDAGLMNAARSARAQLGASRFAAPLRPLTGLAALAARDLSGRPASRASRAMTLLAHRWTGRLPRA